MPPEKLENATSSFAEGMILQNVALELDARILAVANDFQ